MAADVPLGPTPRRRRPFRTRTPIAARGSGAGVETRDAERGDNRSIAARRISGDLMNEFADGRGGKQASFLRRDEDEVRREGRKSAASPYM